jgi:hypothetical protein
VLDGSQESQDSLGIPAEAVQDGQVIVDTDLMANQLLDGRRATDRAKAALGAGDLDTAQIEIDDAGDSLTMLRRELEIVARRAADEMVIVIPAVSPATATIPTSN